MTNTYWDGENWLTKVKNKFEINYYLNDNLHRNDGPASIFYFSNGDIKQKQYYFNGINFNPDDLPFELPIDTEEKEFLFKLKYGDKNV